MQTPSLTLPFMPPRGSRTAAGCLRLGRGAVRSLRFCGTIECLSGSVWLTLSGQPTDYLLRPGETLAVTTPGVVLQALEEAVVRCA